MSFKSANIKEGFGNYCLPEVGQIKTFITLLSRWKAGKEVNIR